MMKVLLNDTHKKAEGNKGRFGFSFFFLVLPKTVNATVEGDVNLRVDYVFPWLLAEQLTP